MIYVCVVTMKPGEFADRLPSLLPGVVSHHAEVDVLVHGDEAPVNEHEFTWSGGAFVVTHRRRLGCAEARALLVKKVVPLPDDILVFLDDDMSATDDGWLQKLIEPILSGAADITGVDGRYVNTPNAGYFVTRPAPYDKPDYVSGGWCAVSGRVFEAGITFDSDYFPNYWEDVDFCLRARLHGFRIVATGDVGLIHHGGPGNAKHATFTHDVFARKWTMRQIEVLRDWE